MQVLVLASASRYRADLLQRLQLPFTQCAPDVDESALPDELPEALSRRLARCKADAARSLTQAEAIVIASDQVATCDGRRLHKPGSIERAHRQLAATRGRTVEFHTALHLLDTRSGWRHTHVDHTRAHLRALDDEEIARYIDADQPLDSAGSFKVESLGISLFESIDSRDPTALIGLPLIALCQGLREAGLRLP